MRKWQNLAAPDDPNSWADVDFMWPTRRGTYETSDVHAATSLSATAAGTTSYAYVGRTTTSTREYVVTGTKIWEYVAAALTDRTGGVSIGTLPMMVNYGDITIGVMGNTVATVKSSGGNFSALAGAPKGEIVLTVAGAVLILNTDTSPDGWAASDVGDYTNWTTGEAASGRLLQTSGAILGAVGFGNDVIAFKSDAIYRGRYVGGIVKWTWEVVWRGTGLTVDSGGKYSVCAGRNKILFAGYFDSTNGYVYYLFDGANAPMVCNPLTSFTTTGGASKINYDSNDERFSIIHDAISLGEPGGYFYSVPFEAWGRISLPTNGGYASGGYTVLNGDNGARSEKSTLPVIYNNSATDTIKRFAPTGTATATATTSKVGELNKKTTVSRLTPRLRRRSGSGTVTILPYVSITELEGANGGSSTTLSESTYHKRFDANLTFDWGKFAISFGGLDVEIDDLFIVAKASGAN